MNVPEGVVVGIDVAKTALDVAVRPSGEERHLANDMVGIADAVALNRSPVAMSPRGERDG